MLHSGQCKIPLGLNQMQASLTSLNQWELGSRCYFQEAFLILSFDNQIRSPTRMTKSVRSDGVLAVLSAPHLSLRTSSATSMTPSHCAVTAEKHQFICFSSGYRTAGFLWHNPMCSGENGSSWIAWEGGMGNLLQDWLPSVHSILQHCPTQAPSGTSLCMVSSSWLGV